MPTSQPTELPADEDPFQLVRSTEADDREFGALLLGSADYTAQVRQILIQSLDDGNHGVVGTAAQSLALQGDVESLPKLLELLEQQSREDVNPIGWAADQLAARVDEPSREAVRRALVDLKSRGSPDIREQVDTLLGPAN